jgi:hypothetical protein
MIVVNIFNSTKELLVNETYTDTTFSPGQDYEMKLKANGNCFEPFYIQLEIEFDTKNNQYYEKYNYETHEDAMNIGFEDSISDWGF